MTETKSSPFISPGLQRVATKAKEHPDWVFTTLAHHIDLDLLREAFRRTRKDGAAGVDGVTAAEYEKNLGGNLQSLLDRAKSGRYRAPEVRRVHIPKGDGRTRPLGIPWRRNRRDKSSQPWPAKCLRDRPCQTPEPRASCLCQ
jgi:retron-type reverse transcriptase